MAQSGSQIKAVLIGATVLACGVAAIMAFVPVHADEYACGTVLSRKDDPGSAQVNLVGQVYRTSLAQDRAFRDAIKSQCDDALDVRRNWALVFLVAGCIAGIASDKAGGSLKAVTATKTKQFPEPVPPPGARESSCAVSSVQPGMWILVWSKWRKVETVAHASFGITFICEDGARTLPMQPDDSVPRLLT